MTAVADAKAVIQALAGKTLDNATMLRVAERVIASQGGLFSNPWDETANPTEYAAWPTTEEKAQFFLDTGTKFYKSLLYRAGKQEAEATNAAAEAAAGAAAADEI